MDRWWSIDIHQVVFKQTCNTIHVLSILMSALSNFFLIAADEALRKKIAHHSTYNSQHLYCLCLISITREIYDMTP